jgi:hypothetical protein
MLVATRSVARLPRPYTRSPVQEEVCQGKRPCRHQHHGFRVTGSAGFSALAMAFKLMIANACRFWRITCLSSKLLKSSPGLHKSSPGLHKLSPGLHKSSPGLHKLSPGLHNRPRALVNGPRASINRPPGLHKSSPGLHKLSPGLHKSSLGLLKLSPGYLCARIRMRE